MLQDIIDVYFLQQKTPFDIFVLEPFPSDHLEIFNAVLSKTNGNLSYKIIKFHHYKFSINLENPAILLISDENTLVSIFRFFEAIRYQNQAMRYFIYFADTSLENVEDFWLIRKHEILTIEDGTIFHHSYFIFNEHNMISVTTLEWFLKECNKRYMTRLHAFDKKSMTWIENLYAYEKFLYYNGCVLKMMLPSIEISDLNSYHWGFAVLDTLAPNGATIHGITPLILNIAGEKYNFTVIYAPVMFQERDWILNYDYLRVKSVGIETTIKDPNVYFDIAGVHLNNISTLRLSNVFTDIKYNLFVTPGDPYTPYEKLFLPFDLTTWILLATTFAITFTTICIINRLPKSARNFVYGRKIFTPSLNVVSIFFGISQVKLPSENFSRLILILFVFFCLIFRTCFQSKSFEFLTSEPRRPPPKTIKDLVARNYTIYTLFKEGFEYIIRDERENW